MTIHNVATQCLSVAHDAHHVAGQLMIEKVAEPAVMLEAAKQMETTARQLRRLVEVNEGK